MISLNAMLDTRLIIRQLEWCRRT